jgi:hypothetical protein
MYATLNPQKGFNKNDLIANGTPNLTNHALKYSKEQRVSSARN